PTAFAAGGTHTQSTTETTHTTSSTTDVNPCTGNTIDLTQDSNGVFHITLFPGSDELWATFTETDHFTAYDEGTGVTYTGEATFWGNQNVNEQNANFTFTGTIIGKGSDGSSIKSHDVAHATILPDGSVSVVFDKPSLTCG
ncbi:MAG: hypothetical protein ACXVXY_12740, partial [Mycobacteriaceae bacterium]